MSEIEQFESEKPDYQSGEPEQLSLFLNLDGFEGPIDVLLNLARDQKVDLAQISILQLAEQYLRFIAEARSLNLELAADYLVMAAWLAYLKSRLLLPEVEKEDEISSEEMAEILRFQLLRLEAMQEAGENLMALPRLGVDFFARGQEEDISVHARPVFDVTLYDLLRAYADHKVREEGTVLHIAQTELYAVEDALERLRGLVGDVPEWTTLFSYLPKELGGPMMTRSAMASTFAAGLELAKEGKLHLRQDKLFGPIYFKSRPNSDGAAQ